jgi:hypothetical protein
LFESLVELEAEVETRDADGMVAIEKEWYEKSVSDSGIGKD